MSKAFIRGVGFMACLTALQQDWHGLEGYIVKVRAGWVNIAWWVWLFPLAIIILGECATHNRKGGA